MRYIYTIRNFLPMTILLCCLKGHAQEIYVEGSSPAAVQMRTNLLHAATLCPNIGVEIQTDLGLAWQLDYTGAWWNNRKKKRYYSFYGFQTELRYYINSKGMEMPYTHHHVGIYGQMMTYDFEFGNTGFQSPKLDMTFAAGISYGFVKPVSKHWSFDFTIGVGYFQSTYHKYEPTPKGFHATNTRKIKYGGPTKLEITAIWYINTKNNR